MATMARRALCCLAGLAGLAWAQPLPEAVQQALQQAVVPAEALGAVVLPVPPAQQRGPLGPRWAHQADRLMQPASTLKLLTSVVALDRMGPNVRGFTELLTRAPQQGDVLAGDLLLRGGADPEFDLPQLWALLLTLRQTHGLREIAGDIVIDRTLFRPARPQQPAGPFDDKPEFAYNLVPDALQLNSHLLQIELASDADGRVQARALPPLPGLVIDASALRPGDQACADWARGWLSPPPPEAGTDGVLRVRLQGSYPRNCTQRPSLHLLDPLHLAERQLRWVWASLGGQWAGRVREADQAALPLLTAAQQAAAAQQPWVQRGGAVGLAGVQRLAPGAIGPGGLRLLASHEARPWGETLRTVNKQSANVWSRLLYLQLGVPAMADQPGIATAVLAERAVQQWLAAQQIDSAGLVMDNGSGLSRSERITPRTLALALQAALRGRWAPDLLMSLPLAGVDGTLRNRLNSGPASGQARLKTGLLRDVSALAGVVSDPQGRPWVLVAFINHPNAGAARPALDALVDWVAGGGLGQAAR